jgi:Domain of unknown function (DUF6532)
MTFVLQIKSRGSRIRGELVSVIRSEVALCYGFNSDTSCTKVVRQNRKLYDALIVDSTFTYKVPTVFQCLMAYVRYHFRILKIVKAMLKTKYLAFLSRTRGSVAARSRRELYLRSISIPFHWRLSRCFLPWFVYVSS